MINTHGLPRYKAHQKIAEEYNVSRKTVYYWLTPEYRERERKAISPSDLKPRSQPGRYQREPNRREYDKAYKWFTRHLSQYIPQAFEEYGVLSLKELSDGLAEVAESDPKVGRDIHLQKETLEKHIQELDEDFPLIEIETGVYQWKGNKEG